jgi:carbonic anhydrase/acetyltransferase-like protein (isoleucine patch superfamily)
MIGDGGHAKQIRAEFGDINVVAIGDNAARKREVEARPGEEWSPGFLSIYCNRSTGWGTVAMAGCILGANARVGSHCILNHQCTVDHDAVLEDFVHVAPGARVLGGAKIGEGALIGANAVVLPGAEVPAWFTVRACSVFPADYAIDCRTEPYKYVHKLSRKLSAKGLF